MAASRISAGRKRVYGRRFAPAFRQNHVRVVRARGPGRDGRGLPPAGGKTGAVRPAAGKLRLWRTGILCHGHAHAHRRDSAGGQILRRPADKNRGQRQIPRQQRRHRPLRAGVDSRPLRPRPRQTIHKRRQYRFPRRGAGFLDELSKKFAANQGEGLAFLAESSTSPSRARLQKIVADKFPKSQWFTYDAIDSASINARRRRRSASRCARFTISTRRKSSCRWTAIFSAAKTTRTITSADLLLAASRARG